MTESASAPVPPADRPHGAGGRFVASPDTAERDAEACRLRSRGMSYPAIAKQLGYADPSGASKAVSRALRVTRQDAAEEVRTMELSRLDDLYERMLAIVERSHPTVSVGKVLDVEDDGPRMAAVDRLLRIQERRARLLGLDAPQRISVDAENLGREIAELLGELGASRVHDNSDYRDDPSG